MSEYGISSPCIRLCALQMQVGGVEMCKGCLRTRDEIGRWSQMSETQRQYIMHTVLPLRGTPMVVPEHLVHDLAKK